MDAYQSHATSGPNTIAQAASIEALSNGAAFIEKMHKEYDQRRQLMTQTISQMEALSCTIPQGAFYVMLDCSKIIGRSFQGKIITDTLALSDILLEEAKIAVVPGEPFGAPGFCRLSYAISRDDIRDGLNAIDAFVKQLS
jgi:aspartate aminotransferase